MKVSMIDGEEVTPGSYNYNASASTTNDENLVILHDSQMATDFETQYNRMWKITVD